MPTLSSGKRSVGPTNGRIDQRTASCNVLVVALWPEFLLTKILNNLNFLETTIYMDAEMMRLLRMLDWYSELSCPLANVEAYYGRTGCTCVQTYHTLELVFTVLGVI